MKTKSKNEVNDEELEDENPDYQLITLMKEAYQEGEAKISFIKAEDSVSEIIKFLKRKNIKLDPDWQRDDLWNDLKRSQFIESLILGIPIPPIFLNIAETGEFVVIDGRQRITAIRNFFLGDEEGKFLKLCGLEIMEQLNGFDINSEGFSQEIINRVEDYKLQTYRVSSLMEPLIIYDIFRRINTKGTPLNAQEIRNGLYQGLGTSMIKKIAKTEEFKNATRASLNPARLRDQEAVLRMLAPVVQGIEKYPHNGNIDEYLRKTLYVINFHYSDAQREDLKERCLKTLRDIHQIFGNISFRTNPFNEKFKFINMALVDSVFFCFFNIDVSSLDESVFLASYKKLFEDPEFIESIGRRSYSKKMFDYRIEKMNNAIVAGLL